MKSEFDLREWVLLTTTKGVGPAAVRDLLAAFGSPGAARRAPLAELCKCVPEKTAASIQRGGGEKEADIAVQWAARSQCRILTLADADYPPDAFEIWATTHRRRRFCMCAAMSAR